MQLKQTTRREFGKRSLQSLLTFSLLDTLIQGDLFAEEIKPLMGKWVAGINELAADVKDEKIKQLEWQKQVEALMAKVDLPSLLKLVDFERLSKGVKYKDRGELSLRFKFKEVDGIPTKLVFGKQIFALKEGRSVVPHGHNNMATAFIVLDGEFRGRHYDRLEDEKDHLIIRPTIDRKFRPGEFSTVSDYKDNIHWFKTASERGFIFNFHVLGLASKGKGAKKPTGRVYLDPNGEKLKGGLVRARRIGFKEVVDLYG